MAVNLSMLAGAGAQFFDNSGVILSGGLIYTYAAGTTTPQATYTTSSGSTAHANPIVLDSAGRIPSGGEIWLTDAISYKFVLKTSAAVTIATYDNVTGNASGIVTSLAASSGSSLVGYIQTGIGAVATTVQARLRQYFSVKDFGATGNGSTNDTVNVQAAIDAVFAAGGGTLFFPAGTYLVSTLVLNWGASATSVKFLGAGKNATVIQKTGGGTAAVFALSASASDGTYSEFSDMRIIGTSSCHGFSITNLARNVWRNVRVNSCNSGIENLGSLINTFYDCDLLSNVNGYRSRKSSGIYCNLIEFFGGSVRSNSTWGFDIGDTNGLHLYGTDIERNGTAVGTGGGFIARDTCDDESGISNISLNGVWFESNYGNSVYIEACTGLKISIKDTPILNSELGKAITCLAVGVLTLDRVIAASAADTVTVSAVNFVARQCTLSVVTNTSTAYLLEDVVTLAGTTAFEKKTAKGTFYIDGNAIKSGGGFVSAATATAVTIFAPANGSGMYEVYANVDLSSAAYMSNARIGYDGSAVTRMGGENGANLTITVSGSNIQVTQTSGVTQNVRYSYIKIG
jgi:hypothetical protein